MRVRENERRHYNCHNLINSLSNLIKIVHTLCHIDIFTFSPSYLLSNFLSFDFIPKPKRPFLLHLFNHHHHHQQKATNIQCFGLYIYFFNSYNVVNVGFMIIIIINFRLKKKNSKQIHKHKRLYYIAGVAKRIFLID